MGPVKPKPPVFTHEKTLIRFVPSWPPNRQENLLSRHSPHFLLINAELTFFEL
jgi:hypothetical protein